MRTTNDTQGTCKYCDNLTDRMERGHSTGYRWEYVCSECDMIINYRPTFD